ncbi:MAG TPA: hypothetical protein DCZ72_00720 [Armatimonadetes bacterium]|nr:hypothetical protein [Armatimonadota bacterium]
MSTCPTCLRVRDLVRDVPHNGGLKRLLAGVTFDLQEGQRLAVVGPSGSGKTTLLRQLCALDSPTSGSLVLDDRPYDDWSPMELRRLVAWTPQTPTVFPGDGWTNLLLPAQLAGADPAPVRERLTPLLPLLGLTEELVAQPAATLSIGQQQRLCLARALSLEPRVLLLDEPTASLDPSTAEHLLAALGEHLARRGQSLVLVTHQLPYARLLADRVLLLVDGRQVCVQPTEEFFHAPATSEAAEYVAAMRSES